MEDRSIPAPTVNALNELNRLRTEKHRLDWYQKRLIPLALSYEYHQRQFTLLMWTHVPLTLFILLFAVIGGHIHTTWTVASVYSVLFVVFVAAILTFGVQTRRIWLPRAFALALFGLSLWSALAVAYAVWSQVRMRQWYDLTLLGAQAIDVAITIGYFYTAEMLAGIGGEASAVTAEMHYSGAMLSPLASHLGSAASSNQAVLEKSSVSRMMAWINSAVSAGPRARRPRVHSD